MASVVNLVAPFFVASREVKSHARDKQAHYRIESASFAHALVALAAKLAAVDGVPNKAEYAAFHALFIETESEASTFRNLFLKHVTDTSSALQYARQIVSSTKGDQVLHLELMNRLIRIANADAALNAAELEFLRAVANIFALDKEQFRSLIASRVSDQDLRDHYMTRVQMLHPDRYQAAGASAETIAMLSDQLAAVNAAYQTVQKLRAKKSSRNEAAPRWWNRLNAKGAKVSST